LVLDDPGDIGEVNDDALRADRTVDGHLQPIGMTVQPLTFPGMPGQLVGRLEPKTPGDARPHLFGRVPPVG
jgi:hypothetical protein